jgi:hypothetical protein
MISVAKRGRQRARRVRQLAQKLFNERMKDAEWGELRGLLTSFADARRAYIDAVLVQTGLVCMGRQLYRGRRP